MATDPARDGYLRLIEARSDIDGRFINLRRVGTAGGDGQFSMVFSATDNATNSGVAVKVFRPDRLVETYRYQCFCREATLLERLAGTRNVLGWVARRAEFVEQVRSTSGIPLEFRFPYFAVELASADVGAIIRTGGWSPEKKLIGFREMCKAVQRIHKHDIAHRDVKPSNFLVMSSDEVKLSDFGTARDLTGNEQAILPNYCMAPGDTRYCSPEMLALLHDDDPSIALKGDVYALGATLFELWSGAILGLQLFSPRFAIDMGQAMNAVHKRDRLRVYLQFVQSVAAGHPLPPISAYGADLPPVIRDLIDDLYKSMAALDYRQRVCDFERIFLRIDQCVLLLRNEEKVRRWRQQKEIAARNREEKCDRLREKVGPVDQTGDKR